MVPLFSETHLRQPSCHVTHLPRGRAIPPANRSITIPTVHFSNRPPRSIHLTSTPCSSPTYRATHPPQIPDSSSSTTDHSTPRRRRRRSRCFPSHLMAASASSLLAAAASSSCAAISPRIPHGAPAAASVPSPSHHSCPSLRASPARRHQSRFVASVAPTMQPPAESRVSTVVNVDLGDRSYPIYTGAGLLDELDLLQR